MEFKESRVLIIFQVYWVRIHSTMLICSYWICKYKRCLYSNKEHWLVEVIVSLAGYIKCNALESSYIATILAALQAYIDRLDYRWVCLQSQIKMLQEVPKWNRYISWTNQSQNWSIWEWHSTGVSDFVFSQASLIPDEVYWIPIENEKIMN